MTCDRRWEWSTAEYTEIDTGDNHIARYSGLNFVGIVFNKTVDCSSKTHLHLDVLCMDEVSESTIITVSIYYGTTEIKYPITLEKYPDFKSKQWLSLDLELEKENKLIPQLALACDDNTRNILLDNIYFY